jgi:uncharacterized protein YndB with AHSA1/START domain
MSIQKDEATGKRWIAVETEVAGTPEEVWDAIATGPGVSSWFVPTKFEDGKVTYEFGPGMEASSPITEWDPPHRFAATSSYLGPDGPPMATEWTVEAKAGGTCVVRVVHSLFASTDDWDSQLTGTESGWPSIFRVLRLYMTKFKGQPTASFQAMGTVPGQSESEAWPLVSGALALPAESGASWAAPAGAPPLKGRVEWAQRGKNSQLMLLETPLNGMLMLTACSMGEQVMLLMGFFVFGDGAKESVATAAPVWQAWLQQQFA